MKVYLAGAYERRAELLRAAALLELLGHQVTSRWLQSEVGNDSELSGPQLRDLAVQNLRDIFDADAFVGFAGYSERGGRHAELGYALGLEHVRKYIVGVREHLFHHHHEVSLVPDWIALAVALGRA